MRPLTMALLLLSASPAKPASAAQDSPPADLVGKVWVSTDPSASPGTFRIFLADGTLVMDSCGETYRLAGGDVLTIVTSNGRKTASVSARRSRS